MMDRLIKVASKCRRIYGRFSSNEPNEKYCLKTVKCAVSFGTFPVIRTILDLFVKEEVSFPLNP